MTNLEHIWNHVLQVGNVHVNKCIQEKDVPIANLDTINLEIFANMVIDKDMMPLLPKSGGSNIKHYQTDKVQTQVKVLCRTNTK